MGDISVILEGVESAQSQKLLYSTVHGAGRAMGRMQAKGKRDRRGNVIREGLVLQDAHEEYIKKMGVEVRGGDLDESPLAYKRIEKILEYHKDTIKILHTLRPIGVCMADGREFDPYKD
jgi:tRNA-splicing ligase RtcB